MVKRRVPNVVRGGIAIPLKGKTNYYYMSGRKHSQGGIDIGKNPRTGLEVEDGEVMSITGNGAKVFSSLPFLNGVSPAERVMRGENPNQVFNAQERFKDRNGINDDGSKKKRIGGQAPNKRRYIAGGDNKETNSKESNSKENNEEKKFLDHVDDVVDVVESPLSLPQLGLTGVTLAAPNPYTGAATAILNGLSTGVDIYQTYRSASKRETANTIKNGAEIGLGLVGAKALKNANRLYALDKAANVRNIPRQTVVKTVGRGRSKYKYRITKAQDIANNYLGLGIGTSLGSSLSSIFIPNTNSLDRYSVPSDNTKVNNIKYKQKLMGSRIKFENGGNKKNKSLIRGLIDKSDNFVRGLSVKALPEILTAGRIVDEFSTAAKEVGKGVYDLATGKINLNDDTRPAPKYTEPFLQVPEFKDFDINLNPNAIIRLDPYTKRWLNKKIEDSKPKYNSVGGRFKAGGLYSVTSGGKTVLRKLPSTGEDSKETRNKAPYGTDQYGNSLYSVDYWKSQYDPKKDYENYISLTNPNPLTPSIPWGRIPKSQDQIDYETANSNVPESIRAVYTSDWRTRNNDQSYVSRRQRFINYMKDNPTVAEDTIGLTSNIVGGIISNKINNRMLNSLQYTSAPVQQRAAKLKTRININPQLDKMRESLATYERSVDNNTSSSQVALSRKQRARLANVLQTNELYGNKENAETELINKDRLNQQRVANNNIAAYNNWAEKKAVFDNAVREKRSENNVALLDTINAAVQNTLTTRRKRRSEDKTIYAMMLSNPNLPFEAVEEFISKNRYNKLMGYIRANKSKK